MKLTKTLQSKVDASCNFIFEGDFPGYFEARYVRRKPDYFVCYLSPQSGCQMGCRFCWLTTTGQVYAQDASVEQILQQAETVLKHYRDNCPEAKVVHFSAMARGESAASQTIQEDSDLLLTTLGQMAIRSGVLPRFMISTIMPKCIEDKDLREIFPIIHPTIYYSIYSMDPAFRAKWMPKAMDPYLALQKLKDYQDHTGKVVRLHWAFIEGQNDSLESISGITNAVNKLRLRVDVNLVRYNPYSELQGKEPSLEDLLCLRNQLSNLLPQESTVKIVVPVDSAVRAACGQFVTEDEME